MIICKCKGIFIYFSQSSYELCKLILVNDIYKKKKFCLQKMSKSQQINPISVVTFFKPGVLGGGP